MDKHNGAAAELLLPQLYPELERLAGSMNAGWPESALETMDLVHEAYLKLVGRADPGWNGRAHFCGAAARAMREVLSNWARHEARTRHGGELREVPVEDVVLSVEPPADVVVALHEALERLEVLDRRKAEIVALRYFEGLTERQTAQALGISTRTVEREWRSCRSWLHNQLTH